MQLSEGCQNMQKIRVDIGAWEEVAPEVPTQRKWAFQRLAEEVVHSKYSQRVEGRFFGRG